MSQPCPAPPGEVSAPGTENKNKPLTSVPDAGALIVLRLLPGVCVSVCVRSPESEPLPTPRLGAMVPLAKWKAVIPANYPAAGSQCF